MKREDPVKILLVDDRLENLLALEVTLANMNYELVKATSGKEALKILLKEQDFALILMDALMPIMDGFEAAEMIRQNEKLKYVPIIFLTAQMNAPEQIFKGYQAGAVDYMLKPLSPEILKAKVAVFVDIYRKNNALLSQETMLKVKMNQLAEAQWLAHIGSWEWDIVTDKMEWSDELYRIYGLNPRDIEATYENYLKHIHPDDRKNLEGIIQQAINNYQPFNFFHKLVRKDGMVRVAHSIGKVIKDSNGKIIKMTGTAQDITEQKQAEEKALHLIEEKNKAEREKLVAEEATKSKQQFLANMSHEIRTPMNAIIGFTKVILKTDLNEKQKEYLNAIKTSGDSLIVLINDILDLAKVDSGKMSFEKIPFKLSATISSMLLLFDGKIKEKNLKLVREYDDSVPDVLLGDPVRLQQIILNLLSNAVKFTKEGKITVSVRLLEENTESASIEFSVADTGIGIPENKIGKIFENFQQATSKTARLFGGSGLGLSIVKQLVETQHGTISVKSKVGEGSIFSFILNFKKTNEKMETETDQGLVLEDGVKNIKVLVAEDVKMNQLLMQTVLEEFGFKTDLAENGKVAIEKLKKNEYDIVLMDIQMPEMDGFEATELIRRDINSRIPIIALTADVTSADVAKCKSVGMNDYISKPIDEKFLYNMIVKYVKGKNNPLHNGNGKTQADMEKQKCTNLDYLKNLTRGNPKMIMEMINVYLQENPKFIDKMKQAIDTMDWELLQRASHSIKPSFSTMGISKKFTDMVSKIQEHAEQKQKPEAIKELFQKIETVCSQAREELEEELVTLEKI